MPMDQTISLSASILLMRVLDLMDQYLCEFENRATLCVQLQSRNR